MILGFTGTSQGTTHRQRETVRYLFFELRLTELHHGDCIGADAQADADSARLKARVVVHPPIDPRKRAFVKIIERHVLLPEKEYLKRNRDIVVAGVDGLIAAPKETIEVQRSGTWATVRYARKARRRIWIVFPDGTFKEERA